ncbi:BCCT family transporter [Domibacillus aminovorans]|uniref:Glycine/betaine ABC transporter n=1 Tax=Domibacillus aminovorans TaxID=29332 RepID=A0A177L6C8_9BACI|nr:BCCT family transporter [Domibacillus aminovorans]OAH60897.1 glycine/betaine ABC transporter [Domibacillus aminovorans]
MKERKYDLKLIVTSLVLVLGIVFYLAVKPEQGTEAANWLFNTLTTIFGSYTLIFTFLSLLTLVFLFFSKYGNIRLDQTKPEYSNFSWVAMMLSAGLGSATVYWGFVEWAYYYTTPALGVTPESSGAYEWAMAYNLFHWGFSAWGLYCIAALPVAYHFHVRKNKGLSLSAVFLSITGWQSKAWIGKIIDLIFIFTCFGGLSITLALSIPMISEGIAKVLGIGSSFTMNIIIVIIISIIYSLSSYIGIEKGMKRISDLNTYFAIAFALLLFIMGPSIFILKNTTNGLGLMFQNFIQMSLWTDPIDNGGFPEGWTIFYWLYWITYTPFMAIFVTKVSKGRKIKELILNMVISGSFGCWFFFGVLTNFSMNKHITGAIDVPGVLDSLGGNVVIMQILGELPWSSLFILMFTIISTLFLATTLDSASYTLAATVTPGLKNNQDPSALLRLFWCVMLAVVPLTMILIKAPLETIKTTAIVTAIPLTIILVIMIIGFLKWMVKDYGHIAAHQIVEESVLKPEEKEIV